MSGKLHKTKEEHENNAPMDPIERIKKRRKDPKWRERVGNQARAAQEAAARSETTQEEVLAEPMQAMRAGLPVNWRDGAGKHNVRGHDLVPKASAKDIENYANPPTRTCGQCQFFNLEQGRQEMARQRFAERVVLEDEWRLHHLGAPLDHYGLCDASGGTMATSSVTDAGSCDQFRPNKRLFRLRTKG